jgi:hypothetical protein
LVIAIECILYRIRYCTYTLNMEWEAVINILGKSTLSYDFDFCSTIVQCNFHEINKNIHVCIISVRT